MEHFYVFLVFLVARLW